MIQPLRLVGFVVSVGHLAQPVVAAPAQTSAAPARVRVEVRSTADSVLLVGDLHLPAGSSGRAPGIVLLGVTGPNDRRLAVGRLAPFDSLARRLAEQGIAVLTLDDRGVGDRAATGRGPATIFWWPMGCPPLAYWPGITRSIHPGSDSWGCQKAPALQ